MLPIITLTTDFGLIDGYVATMKGVILSICPSATLVDISHGVPPHDVMHGAFVLGTSHRYFPAGTINLGCRLYTSLLPNLMVSGIAEAIRDSNATKIYVCNVATQKGETEGYSVIDHHEALKRHTSPDIVNHVVANETPVELGPEFFGTPVVHDGQYLDNAGLVLADLTSVEHPVRHDSEKLARIIMDVYHRGNKVKSLFRLGRAS